MSLQEIIKEDYEKWGNRPFIYEKKEKEFVPITFQKFIENTLFLANALLKRGHQNQKILLYGENSIPWMITDIALLGYVGVSVTVNKEWKEEELSSIIQKLDIAAVFYSSKKKEIMDSLKQRYPDIPFYSLEEDIYDLIEEGKREDLFAFPEKKEEELSKIVFSSGTTSFPKAVMLSLKNMLFGFPFLEKRAPMNEGDRDYLALPLHHTYAGIYNFLYAFLGGWEIYLCRDTKEMAEDFQKVEPTIFCGVPLIYERFYELTKEKSLLASLFGPKMKYLFCGGAAFSEEMRKFYQEAGLNLLEAYALSETASSFSIQYSGSKNTSSVGTVFEAIDVKIDAPDEKGVGEILGKGDNIFLGYYGEEELTRECFDEEGYFHTGDLGYLEGRELYYVQRKDSVLVLENGEKISPQEIAAYFYQAYPFTKIKVYQKDHLLQADFYVSNDEKVDDIISKVQEKLSTYKQIKKYQVIKDSLDTRYK